MTKWTKLYDTLAQNPEQRIRFSDLQGLHRAFGFSERQTSGSHWNYKHSRVPVILTIQPRRNEAVTYQVKRLLAVITEYGLHMSE